MLMLEHTKFMLENWYITDLFAIGSGICVLLALALASIVFFRVNDGIQSEDEKLIRNCEVLAYYSLIGYCILAILNFTFLPYKVPVYNYEWQDLTLNRIVIWLCPVAIVMLFEYIRDVRKSNWK